MPYTSRLTNVWPMTADQEAQLAVGKVALAMCGYTVALDRIINSYVPLRFGRKLAGESSRVSEGFLFEQHAWFACEGDLRIEQHTRKVSRQREG